VSDSGISLSRYERAGDRSSYLVRMLRVLKHVATHEGPQPTVADIADTLGMPTSTAFRLVSMLVADGLVQRDEDGHVSPGPDLVRIALCTTARITPDSRLQQAVETLGTQTGESVSAGALVGDQIVLVARHESAHALRVVVRIGDTAAPHTTSMGKAILAHLDRRRQLDVLRRAVGPEAAEAVLAELEPELADVRRYGFAVDEEGFATGQRCRGAALLDGDGGPYAAISISGPTSRYTEERARASIPMLLDVASMLTPAGEPVGSA
jgi:DNA-binding IclR family transcriptional regulator